MLKTVKNRSVIRVDPTPVFFLQNSHIFPFSFSGNVPKKLWYVWYVTNQEKRLKHQKSEITKKLFQVKIGKHLCSFPKCKKKYEHVVQLAVSHNEYLINGQTAGHGTNKLKQIKQKIRKYKEDEWGERTGLSFWLSQRLRHLSLAATTTQEWGGTLSLWKRWWRWKVHCVKRKWASQINALQETSFV